MASATLTKPQVALLTRVMRAAGAVSPRNRSETFVFGSLLGKGLVDGGYNEGFLVSAAGRAALLSYRTARYGREGSMASMLALQEVEKVQAEVA